MKNAKNEFLRLLSNHALTTDDVRCAVISIGFYYGDNDEMEVYLGRNEFFERGNDDRYLVLKEGYTREQMDGFVEGLDVEYDGGYGSQELFGYVMFNDGSWAERHEYDGSEWWEYKKFFIPEQCKNDK